MQNNDLIIADECDDGNVRLRVIAELFNKQVIGFKIFRMFGQTRKFLA